MIDIYDLGDPIVTRYPVYAVDVTTVSQDPLDGTRPYVGMAERQRSDGRIWISMNHIWFSRLVLFDVYPDHAVEATKP